MMKVTTCTFFADAAVSSHLFCDIKLFPLCITFINNKSLSPLWLTWDILWWFVDALYDLISYVKYAHRVAEVLLDRCYIVLMMDDGDDVDKGSDDDGDDDYENDIVENVDDDSNNYC